MPVYYASSAPGETTPSERWQVLRCHLKQVAQQARQPAERTGGPDLPAAAEAAGWLDDVGKYQSEFHEFVCDRPPMGSKQMISHVVQSRGGPISQAKCVAQLTPVMRDTRHPLWGL